MATNHLQDARQAMLLARSEMDNYLENRTPNPEAFEKLFETVRVTTAEYARLVNEHLQQRYGFLISRAQESNFP